MSSYMTSTGEPLPADVQAKVDAELAPGERLVWVGQPLPGLYRLRSIPLLIVGVFFLGFTVLWFGMSLGMGAFAVGAGEGMGGLFACFSLFGLIPAVVGVLLVTSPLWMASVARKTVYALTDKRAIIWEPSLFSAVQVRSYAASGLGAMTRNERGDGSGDLVFEEYYTYNRNGGSTRQQRGFLGIDRVRDVETLVRQTLLGP
jgi:hypothetical protein